MKPSMLRQKSFEEIMCPAPKYKTSIKIIGNGGGRTTFDILSHRFSYGFLVLTLTNGDLRFINTSTITSFDIIMEEIPNGQTGADSK